MPTNPNERYIDCPICFELYPIPPPPVKEIPGKFLRWFYAGAGIPTALVMKLANILRMDRSGNIAFPVRVRAGALQPELPVKRSVLTI